MDAVFLILQDYLRRVLSKMHNANIKSNIIRVIVSYLTYRISSVRHLPASVSQRLCLASELLLIFMNGLLRSPEV